MLMATEMQLFDYYELQNTIKSNLSYLRPSEAPYYFIIIAIEFFLFNSAHELIGLNWLVSIFVGASLMTICILSSLSQKWENSQVGEKAQLRVGRIVGISIPLVAIALTMDRLKLDETVMTIGLIITFAQCLIFLLMVREKPLKEAESINIPQLLIICSSLVFSLQFSLASLSSKIYITNLPKQLIVQPGKKAELKDSDNNKGEVLDPKIIELFEKNIIAQGVLDSNSSIPIVPINTIASQVMSGSQGFGVTVITLKAMQEKIPNLRQLIAFLVACWMTVIGRAVYYALFKV